MRLPNTKAKFPKHRTSTGATCSIRIPTQDTRRCALELHVGPLMADALVIHRGHARTAENLFLDNDASRDVAKALQGNMVANLHIALDVHV